MLERCSIFLTMVDLRKVQTKEASLLLFFVCSLIFLRLKTHFRSSLLGILTIFFSIRIPITFTLVVEVVAGNDGCDGRTQPIIIKQRDKIRSKHHHINTFNYVCKKMRIFSGQLFLLCFCFCEKIFILAIDLKIIPEFVFTFPDCD